MPSSAPSWRPRISTDWLASELRCESRRALPRAERRSDALPSPTWIARASSSRRFSGEPGSGRATACWCRRRSRPALVALYLACLRRGAVYVPLNTAYTEREVATLHRGRGARAGGVSTPRAEPASSACGAVGPVRHPRRRAARAVCWTIADVTPTPAVVHARAATTWPRSSTPRAPRVARRAPCSPTRTSSLQRPHAARLLGLRARRRAAPRAAPLPRPRTLRGPAHGAASTARCILFETRFHADDGAEAPAPDATVLMGVPTHYVRLLEHAALSPGALRRACACSCRARRRCWPRPIAASPSAPGTASSSATA